MLGWLLTMAMIAPGLEQAKGLTVAAKLQSKSAYVGQGVELQAAVSAGSERPTIEPPKIIGADITFIGHETQAISVSAIGDQVTERTVHRFRYRLLPRKAGAIAIPPFRASLGNETGASRPLKLEARELPREGRTGDFLGGIGAFELAASAKPSTIRLGQDIEFRIEVRGTAARGMREEPSLQRLERNDPGVRVEKLSEESTDEPPSRVYTWRIRPSSPGDFHLPPVAISAFDPKIGLYATKATSGIVVRVAEVSRFDPRSIQYGQVSRSDPAERNGSRTWLLGLLGALIVITAVGLLWYRRGRLHRGAQAILEPFQRRLSGKVERAELGPLINQAVKEYLVFRREHSTGALTPNEARLGVERLTASSMLGSQAEELLAESDRLCFGEESDAKEALRIQDKALRFIVDLIAAESGSPSVNSPSEPVQP